MVSKVGVVAYCNIESHFHHQGNVYFRVTNKVTQYIMKIFFSSEIKIGSDRGQIQRESKINELARDK